MFQQKNFQQKNVSAKICWNIQQKWTHVILHLKYAGLPESNDAHRNIQSNLVLHYAYHLVTREDTSTLFAASVRLFAIKCGVDRDSVWHDENKQPRDYMTLPRIINAGHSAISRFWTLYRRRRLTSNCSVLLTDTTNATVFSHVCQRKGKFVFNSSV